MGSQFSLGSSASSSRPPSIALPAGTATCFPKILSRISFSSSSVNRYTFKSAGLLISSQTGLKCLGTSPSSPQFFLSWKFCLPRSTAPRVDFWRKPATEHAAHVAKTAKTTSRRLTKRSKTVAMSSGWPVMVKHFYSWMWQALQADAQSGESFLF